MEGLIDCIGKGKVPDKGGSGRGNTTEGKFTRMKVECRVNSMELGRWLYAVQRPEFRSPAQK